MKYKDGYKYIVAETCVFQTSLRPNSDRGIDHFILLSQEGKLIIGKGYAWNGVNFWPDTDKNMSAGLVHDALYQLMQEGLLPFAAKEECDKTFRDMLKEKGDLSASLCYTAVRLLGKYFITYPGKVLEV